MCCVCLTLNVHNYVLQIVDRFDRGEYVGLFNDAADEILALMDSDTMPQFLRSSFREQL